MREIALDTETTGLDPAEGHRIVEIGCVELINRRPSGAVFHVYVNPERDMPIGAFRIHNISTDFLSDKPKFNEIANDFIEFIQDSVLVIHNARFDIKFLNSELSRLGHAQIPLSRAVDTVQIARRKFPGARANLDALCSRFRIDKSHRTAHGALLDARLLAEVYFELMDRNQQVLDLKEEPVTLTESQAHRIRSMRPPRPHHATAEEIKAHEAFLKTLKSPLWSTLGL